MKVTFLVKIYRKSGDDEFYIVIDFATGPQIVHITGLEWKKLAIRCREQGISPRYEGFGTDEKTTIFELK